MPEISTRAQSRFSTCNATSGINQSQPHYYTSMTSTFEARAAVAPRSSRRTTRGAQLLGFLARARHSLRSGGAGPLGQPSPAVAGSSRIRVRCGHGSGRFASLRHLPVASAYTKHGCFALVATRLPKKHVLYNTLGAPAPCPPRLAPLVTSASLRCSAPQTRRRNAARLGAGKNKFNIFATK